MAGSANAPVPTTYSAQFTQAFIQNAAGVYVEVTGYLDGKIDFKRAAQPIDLTTFAAGGGPVTRNFVRGATLSEFQIPFLFDPVLAKLLRQVIAARGGTFIKLKFGSNAAPTFGDEYFYGQFVIPAFRLIYNTGAKATLLIEVKPADGGIAPTFGVL
jgi:hypothetical protein